MTTALFNADPASLSGLCRHQISFVAHQHVPCNRCCILWYGAIHVGRRAWLIHELQDLQRTPGALAKPVARPSSCSVDDQPKSRAASTPRRGQATVCGCALVDAVVLLCGAGVSTGIHCMLKGTDLEAGNDGCVLSGGALRIAEAGRHGDHSTCAGWPACNQSIFTLPDSLEANSRTLALTGGGANSNNAVQALEDPATGCAPAIVAFSFFSAFALSRDSTAALMASGRIIVGLPPGDTTNGKAAGQWPCSTCNFLHFCGEALLTCRLPDDIAVDSFGHEGFTTSSECELLQV